MTSTETLNHLKIGFACDDYHQLIANRVSEHSEKIRRLIDYIEIGTLTGNSAEAVLATCKVRRAALVDNFSLTWGGQTMSKEKIEARLEPYAGLFEMMEGDSRKIVRNLTEMFDIGFVDGDHAEDSCRIDMTNMLPRLRDDGIMFIHDVGNPSFTYLMPVVAAFARDNNCSMILHKVSDGLAELTRK